ncbi:hypothetical protein Knedl_CDS0016 [Pseudomonas phage Knedl]|nr:hypothetical protein Knedl_CDS0016 [Pseudomonas phage Knedl]
MAKNFLLFSVLYPKRGLALFIILQNRVFFSNGRYLPLLTLLGR